MIIAGISYLPGFLDLTHDNSAALVCDGKICAAAEEERFNRRRHSRGAARLAQHYCLSSNGITLRDVDYLAIANNPYRLFANGNVNPRRLIKKAFMTSYAEYGRYTLGRVVKHGAQFVEHHLAHAACGYFTSAFDRANILIVDGAGEFETFSFYIGEGRSLKPVWKISIGPRASISIGGVYTNITESLAFGPHGAGKTMALAAFGRPNRTDLIELYHFEKHNQFRLERKAIRKIGRADERINETDPITDRHKDLAASIQFALERNILNLAKEAYAHSPIKNWILAGGVALNCNMNSRLLNESFCDRLYIPPPANDGGLALGAALYVANKVESSRPPPISNAYFGPEYSNQEIEALLIAAKLRYRKTEDPAREGARLICAGKMIGWFQGRMEIGPRALGNRSILADPTTPGMNDKINREVKERELWRPFGPAVVAESAARFFDGLEKCGESPYMLQTFTVKNEYRDKLPSITHVDGSSRIQTVRKDQNPLFYQLLKELEAINGYPISINTSFNRRGEPIVCSPKDALGCFYTSGLDALVIGNFIIEKDRS